MSDYEPVLHLHIPDDLPADEVCDAVEFVLITLLIYGAPIQNHAFSEVNHPHIQRIGTYVKETLTESGVLSWSKRRLKRRAHTLMDKLKTYCDVSLAEEEDGTCQLRIVHEDSED